MKESLSYHILLVLALAVGGFMVLYNTVLRESYATTLQYEYPVIEESYEEPPLPDPAREQIVAEEYLLDDTDNYADNSHPDDEPSTLTSVQFPLDINTATIEQMKFIPRVGDVMAQRIVQYREVLGGYTDLEQLREIKGVGDATYERLWSYFYIADNSDLPAGAESQE